MHLQNCRHGTCIFLIYLIKNSTLINVNPWGSFTVHTVNVRVHILVLNFVLRHLRLIKLDFHHQLGSQNISLPISIYVCQLDLLVYLGVLWIQTESPSLPYRSLYVIDNTQREVHQIYFSDIFFGCFFIFLFRRGIPISNV